MPYANKEAQREYQRMWMAARRAAALDGKTCSFCGSGEQLEFHHFDRADKVDHKVWSWSSARRDAELSKCIVLCQACHRRRHQEDRPRFCRRGHELTEANTYWKPGKTTRECRTCRAERRRVPAVVWEARESATYGCAGEGA